MNIVRWFPGLFGVFSLLWACSGGTEASRGAGAAYVKTCALTACQSCRDDVEASCSECHDLCRSPYADSSCFATCSSICSTTCRSCSGSESCLEWEVKLPEPPLDQTLYDACLATRNACTPGDYDQSYCNYFARTMKPSSVDRFNCMLSEGCESPDCQQLASVGTLGAEYCKRSTECGKPCSDDDLRFLSSIESTLRPELERSLRQCMAEDTCSVFKACDAAHETLWQLAWEKADPGTVSACGEAWLDECNETCECGFTCVRTCDTCTRRCVDPCRSDADCVDKHAGSRPATHCYGIYKSGDEGYCEPK